MELDKTQYMTELKYKVGDRVRIKSIDWYNKNKDSNGNVVFSSKVFHFCWRENVRTVFTKDMAKFCGKVVTIETVWTANYSIVEGTYREGINIDYFTDEMIEGLAEEETKPKFKVGDRVMARDMSGIWEITNVEDDILYTIKRENHTFTLTTYGSFLTLYEGISDKKEEVKSENSLLDEYEELTDRAFKGGYEKCKSDIELNGFQLPEGYIFKDENGNEILTSKIILEKKKKEYPKTYLECCDVLNIGNLIERGVKGYKAELFDTLQKLYICRDAYWKIAGDEMGLDKPWEQSDSDYITGRFCIFVHKGNIICDTPAQDCILTFPTEEMRDTFKENFDPDIEICKEFL